MGEGKVDFIAEISFNDFEKICLMTSQLFLQPLKALKWFKIEEYGFKWHKPDENFS